MSSGDFEPSYVGEVIRAVVYPYDEHDRARVDPKQRVEHVGRLQGYTKSSEVITFWFEGRHMQSVDLSTHVVVAYPESPAPIRRWQSDLNYRESIRRSDGTTDGLPIPRTSPDLTWEELWPMREFKKGGMHYIELRDRTIGPFATRDEGRDEMYILWGKADLLRESKKTE